MNEMEKLGAIKSDWKTLTVSVFVKPDAVSTSWLVVTPYGKLRQAVLGFVIKLLGGQSRRESFKTGD